MYTTMDPERGLVHKTAETDADRSRLGREAAMLRVAAHPGVVRLVGRPSADAPAELVLELVPGGDLGSRAVLSADAAVGLGAAVATTLGDLHHLGIVHGGLDPSHVLLDGDGRPVLCGLGRARRGTAREASEDVKALAAMLLDRVGPDAPRRVTRALRVATNRAVSARWLAARLVDAAPSACLPGTPGEVTKTPAPVPATGRRGWLAAAAGAVALLTAVGGWLAAGWASAPRATSACPASDAGCGPLPVPDGILTVAGSRYAVGTGDVVVLGRWACGQALPAVLDPTTGRVWAFPAWPAQGAPETGRLVGHYPGATTIRVVAGRGGCDRLLVAGPARRAVTVEVAR